MKNYRQILAKDIAFKEEVMGLLSMASTASVGLNGPTGSLIHVSPKKINSQAAAMAIPQSSLVAT